MSVINLVLCWAFSNDVLKTWKVNTSNFEAHYISVVVGWKTPIIIWQLHPFLSFFLCFCSFFFLCSFLCFFRCFFSFSDSSDPEELSEEESSSLSLDDWCFFFSFFSGGQKLKQYFRTHYHNLTGKNASVELNLSVIFLHCQS